MGMSDQVGNELDEFVTDTLRNNLLGLPLDLPTINMTRARSEGIPPLNDFRREIFNADQRRSAEAVHQLGRLRAEPQAPGVAGQLRRGLRPAPDDPSPTSADDRWRRPSDGRPPTAPLIVNPDAR